MLRVSSLGGGLGRAGPHVGRGPPQDDSVCFGLGAIFLAWVVSLAVYPAGVGQGYDLVIAVGDHFPLSTFNFQLSTRPPSLGMLRIARSG